MNSITRDKDDGYKATWDDYAKQGTSLDRIYTTWQQCDYNLICTSHEIMVKMEDDKEKIVPIGGTSNFSRTFAKYFDSVVYGELKNKKHAYGSATNYGLNILTGSRTNAAIEKGTLPNLMSLFNGVDKERQLMRLEELYAYITMQGQGAHS